MANEGAVHRQRRRAVSGAASGADRSLDCEASFDGQQGLGSQQQPAASPPGHQVRGIRGQSRPPACEVSYALTIDPAENSELSRIARVLATQGIVQTERNPCSSPSGKARKPWPAGALQEKDADTTSATARPTGYLTLLPYVTTFYYCLAIVGSKAHAYLRYMTYRNGSPVAMNARQLYFTVAVDERKVTTLVKSTLRTISAVLALAAISTAAELPAAPSTVSLANRSMIEATAPVHTSKIFAVNGEVKPIDKKFIALSIISAGSTFADSYTTMFARQNWLAGKKGVCNVEVQSAYLYGTHPTAGRAYAVASVKSVSSALAAYYLRTHHNRFWSLPLVANSIISLQGVSQNIVACN
jgi:hypothetical protein